MFDIDDNNFITLQDAEGNEVDFLLLDVLEYDGHDYLALLPLTDEDGDEGEDELFFLRADTTDDGEVYTSIDSPELFEAVAAAFDALMCQKAAEEAAQGEEPNE